MFGPKRQYFFLSSSQNQNGFFSRFLCDAVFLYCSKFSTRIHDAEKIFPEPLSIRWVVKNLIHQRLVDPPSFGAWVIHVTRTGRRRERRQHSQRRVVGAVEGVHIDVRHLAAPVAAEKLVAEENADLPGWGGGGGIEASNI